MENSPNRIHLRGYTSLLISITNIRTIARAYIIGLRFIQIRGEMREKNITQRIENNSHVICLTIIAEPAVEYIIMTPSSDSAKVVQIIPRSLLLII